MKSAYYTDYREHGFDGAERALAGQVASVLKPGDVVLSTGLTRAPLEYYFLIWGVETPILSYPRDTALHLGAQNDARLIADPELAARGGADCRARGARALGAGRAARAAAQQPAHERPAAAAVAAPQLRRRARARARPVRPDRHHRLPRGER
jgi:hypothetical protein